MTCEHALDDGTYVLGALSPAERAEFEQHMATCATCREAVASLAVLPGLLSRLAPARAIALSANSATPPAAPATILPRVLAAAAQKRRFDRRQARRRRTVLGLAAAIVTLVLAAGVGMVVHMRDTTPTPAVAMSAMQPAQDELIPVSADVGVLPADGGSQLVMTCWYATGYEGGSWVVRLVVFPKGNGTPETVGSWTADPGAKVTITGRTHLTPAQIGRVELQRGDNTALLWWTPA